MGKKGKERDGEPFSVCRHGKNCFLGEKEKSGPVQLQGGCSKAVQGN